ncbi:hypothetical protein F4802DRAFT_575170 [Xylaria palmicola]|nr:hypothetical protein F4802DRAFT_575170 [Xylaria palmicola]
MIDQAPHVISTYAGPSHAPLAPYGSSRHVPATYDPISSHPALSSNLLIQPPRHRVGEKATAPANHQLGEARPNRDRGEESAGRAGDRGGRHPRHYPGRSTRGHTFGQPIPGPAPGAGNPLAQKAPNLSADWAVLPRPWYSPSPPPPAESRAGCVFLDPFGELPLLFVLQHEQASWKFADVSKQRSSQNATCLPACLPLVTPHPPSHLDKKKPKRKKNKKNQKCHPARGCIS